MNSHASDANACALAAGPTILLDLWPHPLTAAQRATREVKLAPGATIADAIEQALFVEAQRAQGRIVAALDGTEVPGEEWATTRLEQDARLRLRVALADGGDSDPLRTALQIAVLVAAIYVPGPQGLALTGFAKAASTALITVGGTMVVNAIAPLPTAEATGPGAANEPQYTLSGGANRARPYEPMLFVLGHHRVYPDLAAREYTEFRDGEQYLMQIFSWGIGDLKIGPVHLGANLLEIYDEVDARFVTPGAAVEHVAGNVDTAAGAELEFIPDDPPGDPPNNTAWVQRRTPAATTRVQIDFTGLVMRVQDNGSLAENVVPVSIRYSLDGATWTRRGYELRGSTRDPLRRTVSIALPHAGEWIVEVRRDLAPSDNDRVYDHVTFAALRSYQNVEADRGADTLLAVEVRASGQLHGRLDRLHAEVDQKIPTWDGDAWTKTSAPSSNPAAVLRFVALGVHDASGRLLAGSGRSRDEVDDDVLGAWYEWCEAEGLECNYVVEAQTGPEELEALIAACGRATVSWRTGRLGVVWEAAARPVSASITPAHILAGSLESDWASGELAEEIVVRFRDPENDWEFTELRRLMPGVETPSYSATATLPGVTSKRQAAVMANLQAARQRYHRRRISWEMGAEGLTLGRGDVVHLTHDLVTGGVAGRLSGGTPALIELDRPAQIPAGSWMIFSLADGSVHQSAVSSPPDQAERETIRVALDTPLPGAPEVGGVSLQSGADGVGAHDVAWRLYRADEAPLRVRIVAVEPRSSERVRVSAIDEVDAYHAAATTDLSAPLPLIRPRAPQIVSMAVSEKLISTGKDWMVEFEVSLTVSGEWRGGAVYASFNHGVARLVATLTAGETSAKWIDPADGWLVITAVPGSMTAPTGDPIAIIHRIAGLALPPEPPENFLVEALADGTRRFRWAPSPSRDVAGYEIRYEHTDSAPDAWEELSPLHQGLLTVSPWESNEPTGHEAWTFALVAVDATGHRSSPVWITAELPDERLGSLIHWSCPSARGWPGTITGGVRSDDGKDVIEGVGTYTWSDVPTWEDWISWGLGDGTQGATEMIYTAPLVDFGSLSFVAFKWSAETSGNVVTEYRRALLGAPIRPSSRWYPYNFSDATPFAASSMQTRWRLTGDGTTLLKLDHLRFSMTDNRPPVGSLPGPVEPEQILDADTSLWDGSPSTGRRIPLNGRQYRVSSVSVTLQSVGAGWSWELVLKNPPTIKIYDHERQPADAIVDVIVYGTPT